MNDAVAHGQPRPVPSPTGFVVKNGWKSFVSFSGATPGPESSTSRCTRSSSPYVRDNDPSRAWRAAADRLLGVDEEIQHDLLQLGENGVRRRRRPVLAIEPDPLSDKPALPKLDHRRHDLGHVDRRRCRLRLTAEPGQVADDRAGARALLVDRREIGAHPFVHLRVMLKQLGKPGDRLQRIVQLVGDAGHEHADGREPFLPDHLLLQRLEAEAHAAVPPRPGVRSLRARSSVRLTMS